MPGRRRLPGSPAGAALPLPRRRISYSGRAGGRPTRNRASGAQLGANLRTTRQTRRGPTPRAISPRGLPASVSALPAPRLALRSESRTRPSRRLRADLLLRLTNVSSPLVSELEVRKPALETPSRRRWKGFVPRLYLFFLRFRFLDFTRSRMIGAASKALGWPAPAGSAAAGGSALLGFFLLSLSMAFSSHQARERGESGRCRRRAGLFCGSSCDTSGPPARSACPRPARRASR